MAQDIRAAALHVSPPGRAQARIAAGGIHLGLLIMCVSAVYTGWQRAVVSLPQWGVMVLVAAALLVGAFCCGVGTLKRTWLRFTLMLTGLLCLSLCYDPQLASIPRLGGELPADFASTYPSIALLGIVIALVSWLAYRGFGGEDPRDGVPLRPAVGLTTGLICLLAVGLYFLLHGTHDLALSESLRPILVTAQGGVLAAILLGIGGRPGIGRAPHVYLALTLLLACARNMAFPMQ